MEYGNVYLRLCGTRLTFLRLESVVTVRNNRFCCYRPRHVIRTQHLGLMVYAQYA